MKGETLGTLIIDICIILFAISVLFGVRGCTNYKSQKDWNNGICPNCGVHYQIGGVSNSYLKYYQCQECGREVQRY